MINNSNWAFQIWMIFDGNPENSEQLTTFLFKQKLC